MEQLPNREKAMETQGVLLLLLLLLCAVSTCWGQQGKLLYILISIPVRQCDVQCVVLRVVSLLYNTR